MAPRVIIELIAIIKKTEKIIPTLNYSMLRAWLILQLLSDMSLILQVNRINENEIRFELA